MEHVGETKKLTVNHFGVIDSEHIDRADCYESTDQGIPE